MEPTPLPRSRVCRRGSFGPFDRFATHGKTRASPAVGTSYESRTQVVIRHSPAWISCECNRRGLKVVELPDIDCDHQYWLRIDKQ